MNEHVKEPAATHIAIGPSRVCQCSVSIETIVSSLTPCLLCNCIMGYPFQNKLLVQIFVYQLHGDNDKYGLRLASSGLLFCGNYLARFHETTAGNVQADAAGRYHLLLGSWLDIYILYRLQLAIRTECCRSSR